MFIVILGIIIIAVSFFVIKENYKLNKFYPYVNFIGFIFIVLGVSTAIIKQVEAGQAGVQSLFGKVNNHVLESGLNVINPLAEVTMFDIKTQNYTMSGVHDEGDKSGDDAIRVLANHTDADCVRGVVPAAQNPFKMWRFNGDSKPLQPLLEVAGIDEPYNAPRQILPPVYWQTGHIDAILVSTITQKKSLTGDVIYPLLIDPKYTVDIDTLPDWAKYEALVYSGLEMVSP